MSNSWQSSQTVFRSWHMGIKRASSSFWHHKDLWNWFASWDRIPMRNYCGPPPEYSKVGDWIRIKRSIAFAGDLWHVICLFFSAVSMFQQQTSNRWSRWYAGISCPPKFSKPKARPKLFVDSPQLVGCRNQSCEFYDGFSIIFEIFRQCSIPNVYEIPW